MAPRTTYDPDLRCPVIDGNERCCLYKDHECAHMGRWYTMKQADIDAFAARGVRWEDGENE